MTIPLSDVLAPLSVGEQVAIAFAEDFADPQRILELSRTIDRVMRREREACAVTVEPFSPEAAKRIRARP